MRQWISDAAKCVDAGLRMTSQREAIAKALDQSAITLTRNFYIDAPTKSTPFHSQRYVERGVFERAGLVRKVDVGDGKSHYEIARTNTSILLIPKTANA